MKKSLPTVLLATLLTACLTACGGSGSSDSSGEDNHSPGNGSPAPGSGTPDEGEETITTKASWAELIGIWNASAATPDTSDTIYLVMQENGDADYLNFDETNSCYDKTTVSLVDNNDGTFSHTDTGFILTFNINAAKTSADVSNNYDSTSYRISKENKTQAQLTPICIAPEPPTDIVFNNAAMSDLIQDNGIWDASTEEANNQTDIKYVAFTQVGETYEVSFYDYKNDGFEGANSECYEKTTESIRDNGSGNFTIAGLYSLHMEINNIATELTGVNDGFGISLLFSKEGVDNLTLSNFNLCPQ